MKYLLALALFASGATAGGAYVVCLTHAQVSSCAGALNFSDDTAEYIEAEVLDGSITPEQVVADVDGIHVVNNVIRTNLGLPTK
jgi:hypothetical protein